MKKNTLLTSVPYELPSQKARDVAPVLIGTQAIKVYAVSPMFWVVSSAGAGHYLVQMATTLGVGDKGFEVTPKAAAEFISHTSHRVLLLEQIKQLGWLDLASALETVVAEQLSEQADKVKYSKKPLRMP